MNRLTDAKVYNSSNQLVQEWSYGYDKAGNRTQSSVLSTGATTTYTYTGPDQTERVKVNSTTDAYSGLGLSYETTSGSTTYYNPDLGRWTQQDPVAGSLGNPDTLNRYLYVGDDPVNETDPSGNASWWCAAALSGIVLGVVTYIQAVQWLQPYIAALFTYAALESTPTILVERLSAGIPIGTFTGV